MFLPEHDFVTSCLGQLENNSFTKLCRSPNVDTLHYIISNTFVNIRKCFKCSVAVKLRMMDKTFKILILA